MKKTIAATLAAGLAIALMLLGFWAVGEEQSAHAQGVVNFDIDPDITGNTANTLGTVERCARCDVAPGDMGDGLYDCIVDVVVHGDTQAPTGYDVSLAYTDTVAQVVQWGVATTLTAPCNPGAMVTCSVADSTGFVAFPVAQLGPPNAEVQLITAVGPGTITFTTVTNTHAAGEPVFGHPGTHTRIKLAGATDSSEALPDPASPFIAGAGYAVGGPGTAGDGTLVRIGLDALSAGVADFSFNAPPATAYASGAGVHPGTLGSGMLAINTDCPTAPDQWTSLNGPPGPFVADVAVHPTNPNILFAAVDGGGVPVYKSTNGGASWSASAEGVTGRAAWEILFDPADPTANTLYVTTWGEGLFRTTNGGASWQFVDGTPPHRDAFSLAFGHTDPQMIYLASGDGVLRSSDGGSSWTALLGDIDAWSIATAPDDDDLVYVGTWGVSPRVIYRSNNGGADWTILTSGLPDANINDIVPIGDGDIVYAATGDGVYKSTDGGDSWAAASTGLTNPFVRDLEVNPGDDQTLYAASDDGVFITTNGAGDWQPFGTGATSPYAKSVKIDPTQTHHVFRASWGGVCEKTGSGDWSCSNTGLPLVAAVALGTLAIKPAHPVTMLVGTYGGGVYRNTQGCVGAIWEPSSAGLAVSFMNAGNAAAIWTQDYVYMGTDGAGMFRSSNDGLSWEAIGPTTGNISEIAIGNTPNVIYARAGGVDYRSFDYGDSWTPISSLPYGTRAFDFHPHDDNVVYAATYSYGVYRTTDGGSTWEPMNAGLTTLRMRSLVIDPNDPQVLYAGTRSGVFKSMDGGESWFDTSDGLETSIVDVLLISSTYPATIYAGTHGDGLFRSVDGGATWWPWNEGFSPNTRKINALEPL